MEPALQLIAALMTFALFVSFVRADAAVVAVVLNRVKSPSFPNTISGVIYQSGAFDAVSDGQINLTPDEDSLRAARDALNGWDPTGGCLYYYNPATAGRRACG